MKRIKQSIAVLLALVMMMALAVPAALAADETFTITGPNRTPARTYYVFQIFTGDVGEDGALTNLKWGQNGTGTTGETVGSDVLNALNAVAGGTNAEKLDVINQYVVRENRFGTIFGNATLEVPAGYYLIADATYEADRNDDIVLEIVGDVTINPKDSDIPTVVKKVYEEKDFNYNRGYGMGFNDVADAEIGERVTFKLVGSIPNDVSEHETYYYAFHDTYSDGLSDPVIGSVYLAAATDSEDGTALTEDVDYTFTEGDGTFTVAFNDLNDVLQADTDAQYIIVEFTMVLDADANIGSEVGNPNEVYLEYTTEGGGRGQTEEDYALVFTWTLSGDKTDGNTGDDLAGAKFVLLNSDLGQVATVDGNGRLSSWVSLTKPYDEMSVEEWEAISGAVMTSNELGGFSVRGLDDDTYYLLEIEAPAGYNLLTAPIKAEIVSVLHHDGTYLGNNASEMLTGLYLYIDDAEAPESCVMQGSGVATVPIANFSGTTLPETGGMGTTIFYIVGAVLVLGVVVILVARKRMENE